MTGRQRDKMKLWRDSSVAGEMDILRASCFDHRYPAHFHEEFTIAAFARGAQRHRISRNEGVAEAGTVMIIPPGEVHTGEAVERDLGWDYCAFYPSALLLEQIADDVLGGQGGIDFGREALRHDLPLARGLQKASAIMSSARDVMERQCAVYDIFGTLIARYGERTGRGRHPNLANASIRDAVAFLNAHYDRSIAVGEIATVLGLSEYHFMRSFRAGTGLSVHRYLTQIRVEHAKTLLLSGVGAAETALSVGFFDQSHLINQFRALLGVTPRAFVVASS